MPDKQPARGKKSKTNKSSNIKGNLVEIGAIKDLDELKLKLDAAFSNIEKDMSLIVQNFNRINSKEF